MIWWIAAAMLVVALIFILYPLWRRSDLVTLDSNTANVAVLKDQLQELESEFSSGNMGEDQYDRARIDLEAAVAADLVEDSGQGMQALSLKTRRLTSLILLLALPLSSVALYREISTYREMPTQHQVAQGAMEEVAGKELPPMDEMIETLAARLRENPDDAQGWRMLGRSYLFLEQLPDAARAYGKAYELLGDSDVGLLVDYAEVLAFSNNNLMAGRPLELVEQALKVKPGTPKALWMAGFASYQVDDFEAAVNYWTSALQNPQLDNDTREMLQSYVADARGKMGLAGAAVHEGTAVATVDSGSPVAAQAVSIQVEVSLDDAMRDKVRPDELVFVFARVATGTPMPLAVKRLTVADLPTTVTLDDSMAMMKGHELSAKDQVVIGARVSRAGSPMSEAGDLQGLSEAVDPKQTPQVVITINHEVL